MTRPLKIWHAMNHNTTQQTKATKVNMVCTNKYDVTKKYDVDC